MDVVIALLILLSKRVEIGRNNDRNLYGNLKNKNEGHVRFKPTNVGKWNQIGKGKGPNQSGKDKGKGSNQGGKDKGKGANQSGKDKGEGPFSIDIFAPQ